MRTSLPGTRDRWLVFLPGNRWHDVAGTDHQLARALGHHVSVLWVDPPFSLVNVVRRGAPRPSDRLLPVAPGVSVLQTWGPPGPSRPLSRGLARRVLNEAVRRELSDAGRNVIGVLLASAQAGFPALPGVPRLLYVTDDWIEGAPLMGLSQDAVRERLRVNLQRADAAAAVSPELADTVAAVGGRRHPVTVVPNGVNPLGEEPGVLRRPDACLIGQLNERLDLEQITAVLDAGVRLRVVGPVTARDPQTRIQLSALLGRPEVDYAGRVEPDELRAQLAGCSVGITPYRDTPFNRSSFPLKTLEYLGAGLPVVSSELPSARWLDSDDIDIAPDADGFAKLVTERLREPVRIADIDRRIAFAGRHSWDRRAGRLLDLLDPDRNTGQEASEAGSDPGTDVATGTDPGPGASLEQRIRNSRR